MAEWYAEQEAKRQMRALELWSEMNAGLDDNLGTEMADAEELAGKD